MLIFGLLAQKNPTVEQPITAERTRRMRKIFHLDLLATLRVEFIGLNSMTKEFGCMSSEFFCLPFVAQDPRV